MSLKKIKINLNGIPQTSLMPLYGRAKISKNHNSLFNDPGAVEIVERLDYDFSIVDQAFDYFWFTYAVRAMQFDNKVRRYISEHPDASVVNLGAGFETGFYRIDNGTIRWYDLDLPEIIETRKQLFPETDRMICIAKSFLEPDWCYDIETRGGVFIVAGGLFHYFEEPDIRWFFSLLADNLPGCEIVFEAESRSSAEIDGNYGAYGAGWSDDEPWKRDALQEEALRAFKSMWLIAPPAVREQLIGNLTTPTRPQGTEWEDFGKWWSGISVKDKGKAMSDIVAGSDITCRSPFEDAGEIAAWDERITVVDQFPLFRDIPRDPSLSMATRQFMDYTDEKGRIKIIHLRV